METQMRKKIRKVFKFKEITEQRTNNLQVSLNCIEELASCKKSVLLFLL